MHCKEKVSSKGQVGGEVGPPQPLTSQYDPDPTQPGTIFTCIPDFNNFHGPAALPSAPAPAGFSTSTLQMRSGGITGQGGLGAGGRCGVCEEPEGSLWPLCVSQAGG